MRRRVTGAAVVTALTFAALASLAAPVVAQRATAPQISIVPASGARDSVVKDEPFRVQAKLPSAEPWAPRPDSMTVDVTTVGGQKTSLTLRQSAPGSDTYISEPATIDAGAQKSGLAGHLLPGNLSRDMNPLSLDNGGSFTVSAGGASASMTVYDSRTKQGLGRIEQTLDAKSNVLVGVDKAARDTTAQIDKKLSTVTDAGERKQLLDAKAQLQATSQNARDTLGAITEAREFLRKPPPPDAKLDQLDLGKLAYGRSYLDYIDNVQRGQGRATAALDAFRNTRANLRQMTEDQWFRFGTDLALGWYQATTSLTMTGPLFTAVSGQTIYGNEATSTERLLAAKDLVVGAAMMKLLPRAVDAVGDKLAGDFGGIQGANRGVTPRTATPGGVREPARPAEAPAEPGGGAGQARAGGTAEGGQAGAGGTGPVPEWMRQARVQQAKQATLRDGFERRVQQARDAGVDPQEIERIRQTTGEGDIAGDSGFEALADGDLELTVKIFEKTHPGARVVTDVDVQTTLSTVRTKATLEASGRPQRWTRAEAKMLKDLAGYEDWANVYELDRGSVKPEAYDQPGYTPAVTGEDMQAIKSAATKSLNIVADAAPASARPAAPGAPAPGAPPVVRGDAGRVVTGEPAPPTGAPPVVRGDAGRVVTGEPAPPTGAPPVVRGDVGRVVTGEPVQPTGATASGTANAPPVSQPPVVDSVARPGQPTRSGSPEGTLPLDFDRISEQVSRQATRDASRFQDKLKIDRLNPAYVDQLTADELSRIDVEEVRALPDGPLKSALVGQLDKNGLWHPERVATGVGDGGGARTTPGLPASAGGTPTGQRPGAEGERRDPPGAPARPIDEPVTVTGSNPVIDLVRRPVAPAADGAVVVTGGNPVVDTPRTPISPEIQKILDGLTPPPAPTTGGEWSRIPGGGFIYVPPSTPGPGPTGGPLGPDPGVPGPPAGTGDGRGTTGGGLIPPFAPPPGGGDVPPPAGGTGVSTGGGTLIGGGYRPLGSGPDGPGASIGDSGRFIPDPSDGDDVSEHVPLTDGPADGACCVDGFQDLMIDVTVEVELPAATTQSREEPWRPQAGLRPADILNGMLRLATPTYRGLEARRMGPAPWLSPAWRQSRSSAQAGSQAPRSVASLITSLGTSQGQAFTLQLVNRLPKPIRVLGGGLVVEPLKPSSRTAAQQLAALGQNVVSTKIEAFCVAHDLLPPTAGMLFRVAPPEVQAKFAPLQSVLQAATKLDLLDLLHPDSNPKAYVDSIKQFALWSKQNNWDLKAFASAWIDQTKKNVVAMKRTWTQQMQDTLMASAPARWRDIQLVLEEAQRISTQGR